MPYSHDDEKLPDNVKSLPVKKRKIWASTWNSVYQKCKDEGGEDCEEQAFRIANGKIKSEEPESEGEMSVGFLVELETKDVNRPFDALTIGEFTDMYGRDVKIDEKVISKIAENTKAAIAASRDEEGELVGLPIDSLNHDKGVAAGWIVDAEFVSPVLRLTPRWTDLGRDLIGSGVLRFFSATLDLKNGVLLGGTLTNWPAVRGKDGKMILKAIALSQGDETENLLGGNNMDKEVVETSNPVTLDQVKDLVAETVRAELTQALRDALPKTETAKNGDGGEKIDLVKLLELDGVADEFVQASKEQLIEMQAQMKQKALAEAAQMLAEVRREGRITEFAAKVTAGNASVPRGLPVDPAVLRKFMLSIPHEKQVELEAILENIWQNGFVEFSELGDAGRGRALKQLPAYFAKKLDDGELKVSDLSAPFMQGAFDGDVSEYDLSKWTGK